jgi:hypothetical protein
LNAKGSGVVSCPQKLASRTRHINTMSSLSLRQSERKNYYKELMVKLSIGGEPKI